MPTPGIFSAPPRQPTPGPVIAPTPPGWPSIPNQSPSSFNPPPLPDHVGGAPPELVLETDIDFSLEAPGSFSLPSAAGGALPASSPLAGIFDGVDLSSPMPVTNPLGGLPSTASGPTVAPTIGHGVDVVGAFAAAETSSLPAPPPPPISVRLRGLAERLRAERRYDDAQILDEAIAWLTPP